jgi:hypothetical protein
VAAAVDPELKIPSVLVSQQNIRVFVREDTPGGKLAELADVGG